MTIHWRATRDEVVVCKSVGVGLADVATAWYAVQRANAGRTEAPGLAA